jgi:hypothetical protein
MHYCAQVPCVIVDRRMSLAPLALARRNCVPRPSWCALFSKGLGIVANRHPELRRLYLPFPRPHLYEHSRNICIINVARRFGDEAIVLQVPIRSPERRALGELDDLLRSYKEEPLENFRVFRRSMMLSRLPRPLRRLVWWITLNFLGRRRAHNFGTCGITSTASQGAGILYLRPLAATLHYGMFHSGDSIDVRLCFDHRVMDGALAATALADLESILLTEIADEVSGMSQKRTSLHSRAA